MAVEIRGFAELASLLESLKTWTDSGSRSNVGQGADDMANDFQDKIRRGQSADGSPMAPLRKATLDGPVRREINTESRRNYGDVPLNATGKTAHSITSKKKGVDTWEISPNTERANMILASNAKEGHSGAPFAGDTPKAVRDPLQVTDKQLDILEKHLLDGIGRALDV
jgi:hypothetical protein